MKWFEANHIEAWSHRVDARINLSLLVAQLVRASVASVEDYDFPTGDSAQRPGYDGRLVARPALGFEHFLPDGKSVWEFGTNEDPIDKVGKDCKARTETPGSGVDPSNTTLVLITGRVWRHKTTILDWIAEKKKKSSPWKDIKVYDAVALEAWLELCPGVAAAIARDVVGTLPKTGALSPEEFWNEYAGRFEPHLIEQVAVAGRAEQSVTMLQQLLDTPQVFRWQGDSLAEVLAFMVASIRLAPEDDRKFLQSRVLIVETEEAARLLKGSRHLIFAVYRDARTHAGALSDHHVVIAPMGRESIRSAAATRLGRPNSHEMAEALKVMGLDEFRARRLAQECDRSVTILARRITSGVAALPPWHTATELIPALLAGAWDTSSTGDREVLAQLAGFPTYEQFEPTVRRFRQMEDAPIETVDRVWVVRAPVDVFVNLANLLGPEHFEALGTAANKVFGNLDPTLSLAGDERPLARMRGEDLPPHSHWLREGLTNTLLIVAALGPQSDLAIPNGVTPQAFVDGLIAAIPSLNSDYRVLASLRQQLPLLMEAAPVPLLQALEHLLEGDGANLKPIFQDDRNKSSIFTSSPHTQLLWALELIAWDPAYLLRAALILLKLAAIDPGGSLANRPSRSLRTIFLSWRPATNATLRLRLVVLDALIAADGNRSWPLLMALLPKGHDVADVGLKPIFREAGASESEVMTYALLYETHNAVLGRALNLAGTHAYRWSDLVDALHTLSDEQKTRVIHGLQQTLKDFPDAAKTELWEKLARIIRHHRAWPQAAWSLGDQYLSQLEAIQEQLQPSDPIQQTLWLFEEAYPMIENPEGKGSIEEVERLRNEAIQALVQKRGSGALFELAAHAKNPRFIGLAAGQVIDDTRELMAIALQAFSRGDSLDGFVSLVSAAAVYRFPMEWTATVREAFQTKSITTSQLVTLTVGWTHERTTWDFVASFGDDAWDLYWSLKNGWGIRGSSNDITYAVEQYLRVNRSETVVLELFPQFAEISSEQLLSTLDQFDRRLAAEPELINAGNLHFYLQQVFKTLRSRDDVRPEQLAVQEYRYLSLFRYGAYGEDSFPLELEKFMAESPEFFVRILSDVYSPASDRGKEIEVTEQERGRAHIGWTLLEGFKTIPGQEGTQIDPSELQTWAEDVLELAKRADRFEIAGEQIGALVAHCPVDPEDEIWPHRSIRMCLELWASDAIERGVINARINIRGVTRRQPKDGGMLEWNLVEGLRWNAASLTEWPRTSQLLQKLADYWEVAAKQQDIRVKQREFRE